MKNDYMYTKDTNVLQISYAQYISLQNQYEEAQRTQKLAASVQSDLDRFLSGISAAVLKEEYPLPGGGVSPSAPASKPSAAAEPPKSSPPKSEAPASAPEPEEKKETPAPKQEEAPPVSKEAAPAKPKGGAVKIAPIKKEIVQHFEKVDGSGKLFEIFRDYYTLLNESCGGMMRVTMKDGICSLWNYDEWEEFAFVDLLEGKLRLSVPPKYAEMLKPLKQCEVPRLLARKRKLIGVEVEDLNELVLDVLEKAFREAGSDSK